MTSTQIESLTSQMVGKRPNRFEPRAVKRQQKRHRLLNIPREQAKELLLQGDDGYHLKKRLAEEANERGRYHDGTVILGDLGWVVSCHAEALRRSARRRRLRSAALIDSATRGGTRC